MRVLLIWPNSLNEVLGWGDLGAIAEPLALEYLAAGVVEDGHEARILDLRLHPDNLESEVSEFDPDIVGVTAFSMHVRSAVRICAEVKQLLPHCVTVVGGHHATILPEDFFTPHIDFVVSGEGVQPLRELLRTRADGRPAGGIPGLWESTAQGFVFGGRSKFDIDSLPKPLRSLTLPDRQDYFIDWMKPVALLRSTVGCPYRCTFCSLWKIMDGQYHKRDIERVVEELKSVEEDFVFLVDDEAFIDGPRMARLATALSEAGVRKRYMSYCRVDTLIRQKGVIRQWRDIGLERLFVGIDAISNDLLSEYNKGYTSARIERALAIAEDLGIAVFAQFVVDPSFTTADFQVLVRFIEHHRIRYPSFTVLTPLPGTSLLENFDDIVELQVDGRPNWDLFDCQNAVTQTRLTPAEFRREYRNLYRVFKGAYTQYREANQLVSTDFHDTDPHGGIEFGQSKAARIRELTP